MTGSDSKDHVRFDSIDPKEEEQKAKRGQQQRKDVVRGIKWHMETEKSIRVVQMKDGYDFVKNVKDFQALSKLNLGLKLTIQGFLSFFYEKYNKTLADMESMYKYFKDAKQEVEILGPTLQEHLILIALNTAEDEYYKLPEGKRAETPLVESADGESDSNKKPRIERT